MKEGRKKERKEGDRKGRRIGIRDRRREVFSNGKKREGWERRRE